MNRGFIFPRPLARNTKIPSKVIQCMSCMSPDPSHRSKALFLLNILEWCSQDAVDEIEGRQSEEVVAVMLNLLGDRYQFKRLVF